jgi:hypothetical protein
MDMHECAAIAPLERFVELDSCGLIDAAIVMNNPTGIAGMRVKGITHTGRAELASLEASKNAKSPVNKSFKIVKRVFWLIAGVGMTLLGLWAAKQLNLK